MAAIVPLSGCVPWDTAPAKSRRSGHDQPLCGKDREALDAIDRATQNAPYRPEKSVDIVNTLEERPTGNSAAQAIRRLRKDRPDLHADVMDGDILLSPD